jgi:hypothetical protein
MRIQLRTIYAGPEGCLQPGAHEVDDDLGARLIAAGFAAARPADSAPAAREIESATAVAAETTESPANRKPRRKTTG